MAKATADIRSLARTQIALAIRMPTGVSGFKAAFFAASLLTEEPSFLPRALAAEGRAG